MKQISQGYVWLAEFRPGEPWKGYPNIDPETDPFVTPGSVINNLSINTVRDVDHLRDRNNGERLPNVYYLLIWILFVHEMCVLVLVDAISFIFLF